MFSVSVPCDARTPPLTAFLRQYQLLTLAALGRKLGKQMKEANAAIRLLDSASVARYEAEGRLELLMPSGSVVLEAGDLDVVSEGVAGRVVRQESLVAADGSTQTVTVALDTTLDESLRAEGFVREFVNRVQALRKEAGFEVSDRIAVEFAGSPALLARRPCVDRRGVDLHAKRRRPRPGV